MTRMKQPEVLRVLTWPDYVIAGVTNLFEERTGVSVVCDTFDQNEEAYRLVSSAPDYYDVVLGDGSWPLSYLAGGLIRPLNFAAFASWDDLLPEWKDRCSRDLWGAGDGLIAAYPGNWGMRGVLYDPKETAAIGSWQDLWNVSRGRVWINSQGSEIIAETALSLGFRPQEIYELSSKDLEEVARKLRRLARNLGGVWRLLPDLQQAFGQHGAHAVEVHTTALVSNVEAACGRRLEVAIPNEGTIWYIDGAMVTAASARPNLAVEYIDLLFSPQGVALEWEESDGYFSTNAVAMEMLRGDDRFRQKIERSELNLEHLIGSALHRAPTDVEMYQAAWRSVLMAVDTTAKVPGSVREAMGL